MIAKEELICVPNWKDLCAHKVHVVDSFLITCIIYIAVSFGTTASSWFAYLEMNIVLYFFLILLISCIWTDIREVGIILVLSPFVFYQGG